MTETQEIGVPNEIELVEQSSIQASYDEIAINLPELMEECDFEDFMNLYSSYDKKVNEDKVGEPKCGMIFDTANEAYTFYNEYARKIDFSVRKQRTNKSKADRNKVLRQSAHYLRSHRRIESSQVGFINKMHPSGFKQSDIYSYMCNEAGGPQYLSFIPSDCYNFLQRKRTEFLKKGDSQCLLEYFKQKQQENKHFFYSFRTTEENQVRGVFFCDAKSRRDYGLFGDAICFDITFRTNNYDMLCAPIVGINNHGQTTLFGCGLLDGETTDAVMWLFTTFLEAMRGKKPVSIFTDQSKAIANAVSAMFPDSHHVLCLWHIYQNAAKHLSQVFAGFKSFTSRFNACIYEGETIEEFEVRWKELLENFKLTDNVWLQKLYEFREKWAQVYSHAYFCAEMTTTQRSESINKFLKKYFGSTLVLREFVDQYAKAIASRREKEREAEYKIQQTSPILVSHWSVECEAAEKYTKKVFYSFQREYKKTLDLSLQLENDDGTIGTYVAKELVGWKRIHKLAYNCLEHSVSCSCRQFEFHGILCSHALKLFRDLQYESLPPQYYLKRWTRPIVDEDVFDLHGDLIPNDNDPSLTIRYSALSQISQRIVSKGSKFPDVSSLTQIGLLELEVKVESWISSSCANQNVASNAQTSSTINLDDEASLQDPTKRKRRGQGNKRKRDSLEGKQPRKKTSCKRKSKWQRGGLHNRSNDRTSQPLQEVEEVENIHDTNTMEFVGIGKHMEQPYMAWGLQFQSQLMETNDGMNALQAPTSSWRPQNLCTSWRASHPTFTEMLICKDNIVEESIGDGGYEV